MEHGFKMIINGDAISALQKVPDNCVDIAFTSPAPIFFEKEIMKGTKEQYPQKDYIIGAEDNSYDYVIHLVNMFDHVKRVLKPKASLFVQMGDYYVNNVLTFVPFLFAVNMINERHAWHCPAQLIWHRPMTRAKIRQHKHGFLKDVEYLFQFTKHPTDYNFAMHTNKYWRSSIFDFATESIQSDFISGFPEEMVEMAIKVTIDKPNNNMILLDPLAGSGTSGEVAKRFGMRYIMIDINMNFCEKMAERLGDMEVRK